MPGSASRNGLGQYRSGGWKNGLINVLVYVKEGAGNYPAPSNAITLTQMGCQYAPHVFGIQVNQKLEILNDDPTFHNVHAIPVLNDAFNFNQMSKGVVTEKIFTKPEVPVRFKCDVHYWMHCMAGFSAILFRGNKRGRDLPDHQPSCGQLHPGGFPGKARGIRSSKG